MKAFRLKAKSLFLTYPKCPMSVEDAAGELKTKLKKYDYIKVVKENHKSGDPHLHVYIQCSTPYDIKSQSKLDLENKYHGNYEPARGTYAQIQDYMNKDVVDVYEEGIPDTERGDRSKETARGTEVRKLLNRKILTENLHDLVMDGEISVHSYPLLKKAKRQILLDSTPVGKFDVERKSYWIYGESGQGKSRIVRKYDPNLYTKPQSKWWDGYNGQPTVLIDDFDLFGKGLSHYIKIWADGYSHLSEEKGNTVPCAFKTLFITSNYRINDIWPFNEDPELNKAISRRFQEIDIEDLKKLNGITDVNQIDEVDRIIKLK